MDPWDAVTDPECEHLCIEVEPGADENDPCIGYCAECGRRFEMNFSWFDYRIECDFNRWARSQRAESPSPGRPPRA